MITTLARFCVAFATVFILQIAIPLFCYWIWGDAWRFARIYAPFEGVADPLVLHLFGKSEGSLAYYILGTVLIGALAYSTLAGLLAMCFIRRRK